MDHPFAQGIDGLGTHPDKAKIDALGMIAEDAIEDKSAINQLCGILYTKLAQVHPSKKLPILYLIDHISKKLGTEFHEGFAPELVASFVAAYSQVGNKIQYFIRRENAQNFFSNICFNQSTTPYVNNISTIFYTL